MDLWINRKHVIVQSTLWVRMEEWLMSAVLVMAVYQGATMVDRTLFVVIWRISAVQFDMLQNTRLRSLLFVTVSQAS